MKFTKETANKILMNKIDAKSLALQYPECREMVMKDLSKITSESKYHDIGLVIDKYKNKARLAMDKINKSNLNEAVLKSFLPDVIKARIAISVIEELNFAVQVGNDSGRIRFNLWDGTILQKILFKRNFERKPASILVFSLMWPFITNKKILMPLVNKKGIYCFYSKTLLNKLSDLIGDSKCLEIGAGDGTLTRFLRSNGVRCDATDDYSWEKYIQYPDFVERLDAQEALRKYKPDTVICSWAPPRNTFEKSVFKAESVKMYIVIGTKNPALTGNHEVYETQEEFDMECSNKLSSLVLPISNDNAVYIFRRKTP